LAETLFDDITTLTRLTLATDRTDFLTILLTGLCRHTGNASKKIKNTPTRRKYKILWLSAFGTFCFAAYTQSNPSGKTKRAKFCPRFMKQPKLLTVTN